MLAGCARIYTFLQGIAPKVLNVWHPMSSEQWISFSRLQTVQIVVPFKLNMASGKLIVSDLYPKIVSKKWANTSDRWIVIMINGQNPVRVEKVVYPMIHRVAHPRWCKKFSINSSGSTWFVQCADQHRIRRHYSFFILAQACCCW